MRGGVHSDRTTALLVAASHAASRNCIAALPRNASVPPGCAACVLGPLRKHSEDEPRLSCGMRPGAVCARVHRWFKSTAMILFLNKRDLMEMKLAKKPLKKFYAPAAEEPGALDDLKSVRDAPRLAFPPSRAAVAWSAVAPSPRSTYARVESCGACWLCARVLMCSLCAHV
jgi:hypothetical protein